MLICVGIWAFFVVIGLVMNVLGTGMAMQQSRELGDYGRYTQGTIGIVSNLISLALSAFCFYGLLQMRQLKSHGLSVAAVVVTMIPCFGPCWCLNMFIGIWGLVALFDDNVKSCFT